MKSIQLFLLAAVGLCLSACQAQKQMELTENTIPVPIEGNTYVTEGREVAKVTTRGIESWTAPEAVLSTWFKVSQPGQLKLFMKATMKDAPSEIRVSSLGKTFQVKVEALEDEIYPLGILDVKEPGYIRIDMQGVKKEGEEFAVVKEFLIDGAAAAEPVYFVRDFEPYWGLRGPSVHMKYTLPEENIEYFYNEITVPEGEDIIGSYFMANGFGEGYCGIQVNSPTERRILFSVWSPFNTDNPADIPEDQRIRLLDKGTDVYTGEFGNEGSGGQSYLRYNWVAGQTYKFVTRVRPDGKGNTAYYAWFFEPNEQEWKMIAGFLRPKTDTWYRNPHSFLENFIPQQGYYSRKVYFDNQWARTAAGEWVELTEGTFTYDATARAQVRLDYAGGLEDDKFYLKNGGFFNENTEFGSTYVRSAKGNTPDVTGLVK